MERERREEIGGEEGGNRGRGESIEKGGERREERGGRREERGGRREEGEWRREGE